MSTQQPRQTRSAFDADARSELLRAIASLRYGTVEATVHDGRIVQIERREKIRLNGHGGVRPASPIPIPETDRSTGSSPLKS